MLLPLGAGADDFVSKPPQRRVLMKRLASMIAQKEAEAERLYLLLFQLESYISSATYQQVQSQGGVEDIYCTILFSDMRGFTAASFDYDGSTLFDAINLATPWASDRHCAKIQWLCRQFHR